TGMSPALVAERSGKLHMVFSNEFLSNYEIYYVWRDGGDWSLPINVSHTTGSSSAPALVRTASGALEAAWQDDTPGYSTIYHGSWSG
ncbi:hypothetical protein NL533_32810, partial [Klebsiella pneumoniae]|nr:hypothetical protein [Klebsiella pneumoniae]